MLAMRLYKRGILASLLKCHHPDRHPSSTRFCEICCEIHCEIRSEIHYEIHYEIRLLTMYKQVCTSDGPRRSLQTN